MAANFKKHIFKIVIVAGLVAGGLILFETFRTGEKKTDDKRDSLVMNTGSGANPYPKEREMPSGSGANQDISNNGDSSIPVTAASNMSSIESGIPASDEGSRIPVSPARELHPNPEGRVRVTWKMLAETRFEDKYSKEVEAYFWYPIFPETVKKLEGKDIYISGYVIPVDVTSDFYVLSAFPQSACFFCGAAGPESVMGLELGKDHKRFKTDDWVTFKGRLKLNADDIYKLNFILEDAKPY